MNIKEILVLHHSHLDVGYTHSQSVMTELQNEYLDQVLVFLDETADWDERDQPKWTCEVTAPVINWLETARPEQIEQFKGYLEQGRIGISAFEYNTTPLCSAEQLIRQLQPARELEKRLGVQIKTLNQHDINGLPWTMVDLMLDSGIELLTMAVNQHFGRAAVPPRPGIFRWEGPSGRAITVMNGNHYTMFDQHLLTWENDIQVMRQGLNKYLKHLESIDYPYDFIYLTSTNCPQMWDNSPPNLDVAKLIRKWNAEDGEPVIRYVTSDELRQRIQTIDPETLPVHRGDWTEFWSFGCGSTARETALNQTTRSIAATTEMLDSFTAGSLWKERRRRAMDRSWAALNLFAEHTWCCAITDPESYVLQATSHIKKGFAYTAREEAFYALISALEEHAGNAPQSQEREHVLLVNPGPLEQTFCPQVPEYWRQPGKRLRTNQMQSQPTGEFFQAGAYCTAQTLAPYSWKKVALKDLQPVESAEAVCSGTEETLVERRGLNQVFMSQDRTATGWIESPSHRLEYDPDTGRVLSLVDKTTTREVLDTEAEFGFFEFVRERADAMVDTKRTALYCRDLEDEKFDISCWQHDWKPVRERALRPLSCEVVSDAISCTLVRRYEAPGVHSLEQRIRLRSDSSVIELEVRFDKEAYANPESIYFAFPLNLPEDWACHFDTAAIPTALDAEQLPKSCRDWLTVDSYVALHGGDAAISLLTPEAPMVQVGGFNICKESDAIPRSAKPLLLSWACNNYWDTNYPVEQPGPVLLKYGLVTASSYDAEEMHRISASYRQPPFAYSSLSTTDSCEGAWLQLDGAAVIEHVKPAQDGEGMIIRLLNLSEEASEVRLSLPAPIRQAWLSGPAEDKLDAVNCEQGQLLMSLPPKRLTSVRLVLEDADLLPPVFAAR